MWVPRAAEIADTPLARNLARWLEARGMTREELARKAGVDPSTLYRAMVEGRRLQLGNLERVAKALGVTPGQLLEEGGAEATASVEHLKDDADRDELYGELLAKAYRLPARKLRILVLTAEKLGALPFDRGNTRGDDDTMIPVRLGQSAAV